MSLEYELIQLDEVDSTNKFLKEYCSQKQPEGMVFCTTKKQTQGYGQQKRQWVTGKNSAILSVAYPIKVKQPLSGLVSLQIAKLVHQVLGMLVEDRLYLKWPNDLFGEQGKVSGVLIEQVMLKGYRCLVIGIGINRQSSDLPESADAVADFDLDEFIEVFYELVQQFGLVEFDQQQLFDYWQTNDFFAEGTKVRVLNGGEAGKDEAVSIEGVYQGVNGQGQAIVELRDENKKPSSMLLSSGLNSIRKL